MSAALRYFFLTLSNDIDSQTKAGEEFNEQIEKLESADYADSFDESDTRLTREYKTLVDQAANIVFESSIIENLKTECRRLAALAITKKIHFDGYSGVVITGFGEKEVFPNLAEYRTDLVIFNKVRKIKQQKYKQNHRSFGKVMSFAQDDITRTILEGINPN